MASSGCPEQIQAASAEFSGFDLTGLHLKMEFVHIRLSKLLHAFHLLGCVVESAAIQASRTTSMHPARIVVCIWVLTSEVNRKSSRLKHFVPAASCQLELVG